MRSTLQNATSFSAGAASGIITQKAITEATKFAKKALFPELTPEHVLAIEAVVENSLGVGALAYFPHFKIKGDMKSTILYPTLDQKKTKTPYSPKVEFQINKWFAYARSYINTRTISRFKSGKAKPYHQSLIKGLMICMLCESKTWWENVKIGALNLKASRAKLNGGDVSRRPIESLHDFLFELRSDDQQHAEKIDVVDLLIDKFKKTIFPELRDKKSRLTTGEQFNAIHYSLQYLFRDILVLITILTDKTIIEANDDINLITSGQLEKGIVHAGLGSKSGVLSFCGGGSRIVKPKKLTSEFSYYIKQAAKGELLKNDQLEPLKDTAPILKAIQQWHPILNHRLKAPDMYNDQIKRLVEQYDLDETMKNRHRGLCDLLQLLGEIKLLKEMTFYFSWIANAQGEMSVLTQMKPVIEHLSFQAFQPIKETLKKLFNEEELLGDLRTLTSVHNIPKALKKLMFLDEHENIIESLVSDVQYDLENLTNTFESVTKVEKSLKRNSKEKVTEIKYLFLDLALKLQESQIDRLSHSGNTNIIDKKLFQTNSKLSKALGLNIEKAEEFFYARSTIKKLIEKYSDVGSIFQQCTFAASIYNQVLEKLFSGTPITIKNHSEIKHLMNVRHSSGVRFGQI